MELNTKFLSLSRDFRFKQLRRANQLIKLYEDYIDFLKKDTVRKIDEKVTNVKEKLYRSYQEAYYDVAEETEIFNTVYLHKYEELKQKYRLKFRVFREKTRRQIAKLDPEKDEIQINELKQSIIDKEIEINNQVEEIAKSWVDQFENERLNRSSANPTGVELAALKDSIEVQIAMKREEISNELNNKLEKRINSIQQKIEKLTNSLPTKEEKFNQAVELYNAKVSTTSSLNNEKKIEKLNHEIAVHEMELETAIDEVTKQKHQKILNVLKTDLEFISFQNVEKNDILKDDEVIAVDNLCMYFGGIKAVNKLSFSVKKKEIFGLIGPNGAGKTTVFNCITQFYKPTAGNIMFRDKNNECVDLTKEVVHNVILQGIVRTFQNLEVIKDITVLDNLLVAAHRSYTSNIFQHMFHTPILKVEESVIKERAIKVLEFMGILKYKDMYAWGLPYGILKKIEIARTLMCDPQLIILDEPAAGLNDSETVELAALIRRIRDEFDTTILLVEHDMGLVMDVCDRICAISFGNLLALGTPEEIQSNKDVQEAYLGVSED